LRKFAVVVLAILSVWVGAILLLRQKLMSLKQGYLAEPVEADSINAVAIMEGSHQRFPSGAFRGGKIRTIMGGLDLDLTDALVVDKPARIEANVTMGGVALRVPAGWQVVVEADHKAGGVADHRGAGNPIPGDQADLVISGKVTMGGLEIRA
jgi:hypothetical protein